MTTIDRPFLFFTSLLYYFEFIKSLVCGFASGNTFFSRHNRYLLHYATLRGVPAFVPARKNQPPIGTVLIGG